MRQFAAVLVCVLMTASVALAQDAAAWLQKGDAEWMLRSQSDDHVQRAIGFYEQALQADAKNATAYGNISRAYYFLGRFAAGAAQEALFVKGVEAARQAVALDETGVAGHYWLAANLAKSIQNKSVMVKLRNKSEIEKNLYRAAELDPAYYFGGPDRVIGMVLFKSPVASNKEAIEHLRKSLTYAPDYSLTLISLAEVLVAEKQYAEAKPILEKILGLAAKPGFERELADDQSLARKLLASLPQ